MGAELDRYYENLIGTQDALTLTVRALGVTKRELGKLKRAVADAKKALDEAENLDDFAENLQDLLVVLKSFPPLKSLVRAAEKVVKSAADKSSDFFDDLTEFDNKLQSFEKRISFADKALTAIKLDFETDNADIKSAIPGIVAIKEIFDSNPLDAPASFAVLNDNLEAFLGDLNTRFPKEQLDALVDTISSTRDALAALSPLSSVFKAIADAFEETFDKVAFLETPLDWLVDALSPFVWVLEKVEKVISLVLDPVIDPILDATGLADLIDDLGNSIAGLLPDLNILNPFDNLTDELTGVFGSIGTPTANVDISFIRDLLDKKNALYSQLFGDAGYLAPLFAEGTDGFDLLVGRPGFSFDSFEIESVTFSGGETGDVVIGSSLDDVLASGGGNDIIIATAGNDLILGGDGDEDIYASTGAFSDYGYLFTVAENGDPELILNYQGADPGLVGLDRLRDIEYLIFDGSSFAVSDLEGAITGDNNVENLLEGTPDIDLILGGNLVDRIFGFASDDRITGFGGRDIIDGGGGTDTVDYSPQGSDEVLAVLDTTSTLYDNSDDVLINVENLIGGSGEDRLIGDAGNNSLSGGGGGDYIAGGSGNDILSGGPVGAGSGSNVLVGGLGNDTLLGGNDTDLYFAGRGTDYYRDYNTGGEQNHIFYNYDGSGFTTFIEDYLAIDLADGFPDRIVVRVLGGVDAEVDKYYGSVVETDTLEGYFLITGTEGNDLFSLQNITNLMYGQGGNDVFVGYTPDTALVPDTFGSAFLFGGEGNDLLTSFSGDESFDGGSGDDTIILHINLDEDFGADADDVFDENDIVIENEGARRRTLDGDRDTDTLDLSQSDLHWVYSVGSFSTIDLERNATLLSTTDISEGADVVELSPINRLDYRDLDVYDRHDDFIASYFERVIGSEQDDVILFEGAPRTAGPEIGFTFEGRGGNDYVWATRMTRDMTVDLGDGDDELIGGQGIDNIKGGDGNDRLFARGNADSEREVYDGGAGNDYIVFNNQFDESGSFDFIGGTGRDLLDFTGTDGRLEMNLALQTFSIQGTTFTGSFQGFEAAIGADFDNTLTGDDNDNILSGGIRDDVIFGGGGNDVLYAGTVPLIPGNDMIYGGLGNDLIHAASGFGLIDGGEGTDTLRLAGLLEYSPTTGFATVYDKRLGNFVVQEWTVNLENGRADQVSYSFADPTRALVTGGFDLVDVENIIGGLHDDRITATKADAEGGGSTIDGSDGNDMLFGQDGDDTLIGGRGDDLMYGDAGDDVFTPGAGNNAAFGGEGTDTLDLQFGTSDLVINANEGTASYTFDDQFPLASGDLPQVTPSTVRFFGIEEFNLTGGDDTFQGANTADVVRGGAGDDLLIGAGGADRLYGGGGNDTLQGFGGLAPARPALVFLNQNGARNDYLTSGLNASFPATSITIEFLMQGAPFTQTNTLLSYSDSTNDNAFGIYAATRLGGQIDLIFNNQPAIATGIPVDLLFDGEVHRFSIKLDYANTTATIFIDGLEVWTGSDASIQPVGSTNGVLVFGQDQDTSAPNFDDALMADNQAFSGGIGDIRIFDELVDDALIYNRAFAPIDDPANNNELWQYWTVDADGEQIVTQPTQQNRPETLNIALASGGPSSGVVWPDTPVTTDAGNYLNGGSGDDTLIGGEFADELFDAFGNNTLHGHGGDDTLTVMSGTNMLDGGQGHDLMIGGVGSDTLLGGAGNDVIVADTTSFLVGNDRLDGGADDDLLQGGDGADVFVFRTNEGDDTIARLAVNTANLSATQATGVDFQVGFDKIELIGFGYNSAADVQAHIQNEGGFAVFSDQETSITFYGLRADQLSIDDFIFV